LQATSPCSETGPARSGELERTGMPASPNAMPYIAANRKKPTWKSPSVESNSFLAVSTV